MAAPREIVWPLEPHTRAKHEILKRYLQAWIPILTRGGFPEIMYVDGCAGPGQYSEGEDGSPIIALRIAFQQPVHVRTNIRFVFIEEIEDRADFLSEIIANLSIPDNCQIELCGGESFETAFGRVLDSYNNADQPLPPTFAFIDPFGYSDVPLSIVHEILRHTGCEVLVNFMYEEINRFLSLSNQESNFDALFGTHEWREGRRHAEPRTRKRFLHNLYYRQLRDGAGAKYVRSFEMRNIKNRVDYYLFYATNSILGLSRMKDAMWKVDESGEFTFSDATDPNQTILFANEPRFDFLRNQLLARFGGREVSVADVQQFVLEETAFRETHYRRVLKGLERAEPPVIEIVDPPPGRRRGTYPERLKSMKLRFRSDSS
ncbi:MAG: three-Cys-motif partner protein TcmP [Rhodospirillaceae bacterium]|nr:three-Cys-motif partner protein TcmP [Rhodospirillaceae bacterium]